MKKICVLIAAAILAASNAWAAGTATGSLVHASGTLRVYRVVAQMGNEGAFTNWETQLWDAHDSSNRDYPVSGYVLQAATYPGTTDPVVGYTPTTTPAANYDIYVYNKNGYDMFGGQLNNRSAVSPEMVKPLVNGNDTGLLNYGPLTLAISNATQTRAVVTIDLYFMTLN